MMPALAPRQAPLTPHEAQALAILAGREAGFLPPRSEVVGALRRRRLLQPDAEALTDRGHKALRLYRKQHDLAPHK